MLHHDEELQSAAHVLLAMTDEPALPITNCFYNIVIMHFIIATCYGAHKNDRGPIQGMFDFHHIRK